MKSETKNYYQILGLSWNASAEDIRNAYRTYAAKLHPDKHAGDPFFEERFKEIREAYETLGDPEKRWGYDIMKFGKSKVVVKTNPEDFQREEESESKNKFRIDVRYLDLYLSAFYFINLEAWVIIRRVNENSPPGGYVWGFFLCALSAVLLWYFAVGVITWRTRGAGSWTIRLNGFNTNRLISQSKLNIDRQSLIYDQLKMLSIVMARNAFTSYEIARQALIIEEENILLAKENGYIAFERFKGGVATYIELRVAQQTLAEAYLQLILARYNAKAAETELLRLKGDLLR